MNHRYLVALGSNRRHPAHGDPRRVLAAALLALGEVGARVTAASAIIATRPLGPSARTYANAAACVECPLGPPEFLRHLKAIERRFGRRARARRWSSRVLDLDIVLWDGGGWGDEALTIPHPHFRERRFVLDPAVTIAGEWRDPLTGLTLRHLQARLTRPRPLPKPRAPHQRERALSSVGRATDF